MIGISTLFDQISDEERGDVAQRVRHSAKIAITGMLFGSGCSMLLIGWMSWDAWTFFLIGFLLYAAWLLNRVMIQRARKELLMSAWGNENRITLNQLRNVRFDLGVWNRSYANAGDPKPQAPSTLIDD